MATPFDDDWDAASAMLAEVYARDYTLARGDSSATVSGQLLLQETQETDDHGVTQTTLSVAILVDAADYLIDDVAATPARGDTFTAGTTVYTVTPRLKGRCWEPHDAAGTQIVVYLKRTT
ncbi:MAG: hypothetical protein PHU85_11540 [Phycisphaerae bacterium]|nr:hypothetical protein [Phycisphaerae bacterium]